MIFTKVQPPRRCPITMQLKNTHATSTEPVKRPRKRMPVRDATDRATCSAIGTRGFAITSAERRKNRMNRDVLRKFK